MSAIAGNHGEPYASAPLRMSIRSGTVRAVRISSMSEHRPDPLGKTAHHANESPPKRLNDDLKNSVVQRHVDYVDLAERVVQGITVRQDLDSEEPHRSSSSRRRVRRRAPRP